MCLSFFFCRGCTQNWFSRLVALSCGHLAQRHHRHCLRDALQVAVAAGGVQAGESGPAHHIAQSELYGATVGVGAESLQEWRTLASAIASCSIRSIPSSSSNNNNN